VNSEKKPIHKLSLALWVLAGFVLIANSYYMYDDIRVHNLLEAKFPSSKQHFIDGPPLVSFYATWLNGVANEFIYVGILTALGVLIELVDQIRWNASAHNISEGSHNDQAETP
jgi:hypothetical protein